VSASSQSASAGALLWGAVLIGAILLMATIAWLLRRHILRQDTTQDEPLSLQQLRELRAQGQITPDEFEVLKSEVIGSACRSGKQTREN
jgi:uncharacterized membrane protein